jgi:hypothetical protein
MVVFRQQRDGRGRRNSVIYVVVVERPGCGVVGGSVTVVVVGGSVIAWLSAAA